MMYNSSDLIFSYKTTTYPYFRMYLLYLLAAAVVVVVIAEMFFDFFNICWFLKYYVKKSPHEHHPYFFFFTFIKRIKRKTQSVDVSAATRAIFDDDEVHEGYDALSLCYDTKQEYQKSQGRALWQVS